MKRLFTLILSIICILSLIFVMSACNNNSTDTSSDTNSDTNSDTSSDTSTDTSSDTDTNTDTSTDTDTDQAPPEDVPPSWESSASQEVVEKAEALLESKHKLTYNEDGSFKVLILADLHMTGDVAGMQKVAERVKLLVDKENPDLAIFTGDNTLYADTEEKLRTNLDAMVGYLEEKEIPWCHVYGNHDYEQRALTKAEQQAIYESYEYCISKDEGFSTERVGNYVHAVYNADGTIGSVIYFLDSGEYSRYTYGYIMDDQIAWYKQTSELLQEYNDGTVINGLMTFHIPLIENRDAYENRGNVEIVTDWDGNKREPIHSADYDTNLFETILERGDVKAIVTGHDHRNDYCFNYKGVKLMASPNISDLTYYEAATQGARVIDLNAETVGTDIPTYVTHLIERLNPDDFDVLDSNVSLEITSEQIENAYKGNGDYGKATGKFDVVLKDGNGVEGSEAIEIVRGNSDPFDIFIEIANKGKLGDNKYFVVWADFTLTEFEKASFGLIAENGISVQYTTNSVNYQTPFYYLPDGENEWQELSHGEDGCFGIGDAGSQGMNGKKGYFAFPIEYFLHDGLTALTKDSVVVGIYFYGNVRKNINILNKPFYFDDMMLVVDYEELFQ